MMIPQRASVHIKPGKILLHLLKMEQIIDSDKPYSLYLLNLLLINVVFENISLMTAVSITVGENWNHTVYKKTKYNPVQQGISFPQNILY